MIRAIYTAIAEMKVGDVVARDLQDITLQVRAEDCPVRMLLPCTEGEQGFVAIGTLSNTDWRIRDLCLWQPLKAGSGIEQCADELIAYVELYGAAVRAMRNPTPESHIESVSYRLGPVLWAKTDFWAIDTILLVKEILQ